MATRKCRNIIFIFQNLWPSESSQTFIISRNIFVLLLIMLMVGSRSIHYYSSFASYILYDTTT